MAGALSFYSGQLVLLVHRVSVVGASNADVGALCFKFIKFDALNVCHWFTKFLQSYRSLALRARPIGQPLQSQGVDCTHVKRQQAAQFTDLESQQKNCLLGRIWFIVVVARQRRRLRCCVLQLNWSFKGASFEPLGALLLSCFHC